jgi:hypothetical protein
VDAFFVFKTCFKVLLEAKFCFLIEVFAGNGKDFV